MENLVSIIIPCFNFEGIVERMLKSIYEQTYDRIELIVVNDGSTDNSEGSILSWKEKIENRGFYFKYISQDNQGLGAAINAGLQAMTGDYFCWGDADDYYEVDSVKQRVFFLDNNPEYAVVTSNAYVRHYDNLSTGRLLANNDIVNTDPYQFLHHLNADSIFCSGCHMVRTSMFQKVCPDMRIYPARRGQNWQLLLPLYFRYKRFFLDVPLYNYVVYPNSMSRDRDCAEDKIARFNEHEVILNEVINQIGEVEHVDLTEYRRFLDDKYAKLRMEAYIKYRDREKFLKEYRIKQRNVGIDIDDRLAFYRSKSVVFNKVYRPIYRLGNKGKVPEEIPEHLTHKISGKVTPLRACPRVSVLIPVFNGEKYIEQCFHYLLNQRYDNVEVIVVNDGSTDSTEELLIQYESIFQQRKYIYKHIYQENARLAVAMNNALQYVSGDYIMIYEVDDVLYRDGISEKVYYLEKHADISMVRNNGYYIKKFDEVGKNLFVYRSAELDEEDVFENILFGKTNNWPASYMIRAKDLFKVLGEKKKIYEHPGGTHLQFMLPMAYGRRVGFIDKPLMDYYAHIDSDSHSGGYEANKRRMSWYEEIRLEVIKRLNIPDEQCEEYRRELDELYSRSWMKIALSNDDKKTFEKFGMKLGMSSHEIDLKWVWGHSWFSKALKYGKKVVSVVAREYQNMKHNHIIWRDNSRSYLQ